MKDNKKPRTCGHGFFSVIASTVAALILIHVICDVIFVPKPVQAPGPARKARVRIRRRGERRRFRIHQQHALAERDLLAVLLRLGLLLLLLLLGVQHDVESGASLQVPPVGVGAFI